MRKSIPEHFSREAQENAWNLSCRRPRTFLRWDFRGSFISDLHDVVTKLCGLVRACQLDIPGCRNSLRPCSPPIWWPSTPSTRPCRFCRLGPWDLFSSWYDSRQPHWQGSSPRRRRSGRCLCSLEGSLGIIHWFRVDGWRSRWKRRKWTFAFTQ